VRLPTIVWPNNRLWRARFSVVALLWFRENHELRAEPFVCTGIAPRLRFIAMESGSPVNVFDIIIGDTEHGCDRLSR
jgi:hypothetical protein